MKAQIGPCCPPLAVGDLVAVRTIRCGGPACGEWNELEITNTLTGFRSGPEPIFDHTVLSIEDSELDIITSNRFRYATIELVATTKGITK